MLSGDQGFDASLMVDRKLAKKGESISRTESLAQDALKGTTEAPVSKKRQGNVVSTGISKGGKKKAGVTGKKIKKVG
jgi:hypothetical protein